jgi:hypothetical protein
LRGLFYWLVFFLFLYCFSWNVSIKMLSVSMILLFLIKSCFLIYGYIYCVRCLSKGSFLIIRIVNIQNMIVERNVIVRKHKGLLILMSNRIDSLRKSVWKVWIMIVFCLFSSLHIYLEAKQSKSTKKNERLEVFFQNIKYQKIKHLSI